MRNRVRALRLLWAAPAALLLERASSATHTQPTDERRILLPSVAQLALQPGATLTTLADVDCGFVAAVYDARSGRAILAYIIRPNGNRLHVVWDMGDHLVELEDPAFGLLLLGERVSAPGFVYPGPKQGTAALLIVGGMLHVYATSRDEGDETGAFRLKRLSMPLPAAPQ